MLTVMFVEYAHDRRLCGNTSLALQTPSSHELHVEIIVTVVPTCYCKEIVIVVVTITIAVS